MSITKVTSAIRVKESLFPVPVTVEVCQSEGVGIHMVGLCDRQTKECLLRTFTALDTAGLKIPGKKYIINILPSVKDATGLDLPIALGIIACSGQRDLRGLDRYLVIGELGLDESVRSVGMNCTELDNMAKSLGLDGCVLPKGNGTFLREPYVRHVGNLHEAMKIFEG